MQRAKRQGRTPASPPAYKPTPVWRYGQGFPRDWHDDPDYPYPELLTPPQTCRKTRQEKHEFASGRFVNQVPMIKPDDVEIVPNGKPGHFQPERISA